MKITTDPWQKSTDGRTLYKTGRQRDKENAPNGDTVPEDSGKPEKYAEFLDNMKKEQEAGLFQSSSTHSSSDSSSFKIKASAPDDNVAQLAAELANGQTKFDVLQVSSKAMRAMANLRMAGAVSEGKEKEKIRQLIRRMNRLLKRIRTKMRNLEKEEQLEKRQEKAEKKREEQKARVLRNELKNKRNKRRREERDYANKEATGGGEALTDASAPAGTAPTAGTAASASLTTELTGAAGAAASVPISAPVSADTFMTAESISVDITV